MLELRVCPPLIGQISLHVRFRPLLNAHKVAERVERLMLIYVLSTFKLLRKTNSYQECDQQLMAFIIHTGAALGNQKIL